MTSERGSRKPGQDEQDYFQRQEQEKLYKAAALKQDEEAAAAAEALRQAHWMRCAKCGNEMDTMPFRGVEVERCPNCGGVYLDQGELETLAGEDKSGVFEGLADLLGLRSKG